VTIIGATGHIGTHLVPRLVRAGYDVVAVSRGERDPYRDDPAWDAVESVHVDRAAAEADGTFGEAILDTDPDAVVPLICFDRESAEALVSVPSASASTSSRRALTLRGFVEAVTGWFGREANPSYLPFDEWVERPEYDDTVETTEDHIRHRPSISIEKARSRLGYEPRYSSLEAVREAVDALVETGAVDAGDTGW
jgi:nucleoside-diphosphate-sugar epimerase